jgi:hypothetical protein
VTGGSVIVAVVRRPVDSVVVVGGLVKVTVVLTGMGAVMKIVGSSGARFSIGAAASWAIWSRLSLAASMRARAHSMSTSRSAFRMKRWELGTAVGDTKAAGCSSVGEYLQGLSGFFGEVVQVAVTVLVVILSSFVQVFLTRVNVFVLVAVAGRGVIVLIFLAVLEGTV